MFVAGSQAPAGIDSRRRRELTGAAGELDCGAAEAILAARLVGSLTEASEAALARHLATCASCGELAREVRSPVLVDAIADPAAGTARADLTTVPGEYYLRGAEIGRGGMGRVVRAVD